MSELHDMIRRCAQPGEVRWIGVRPVRMAAMHTPGTVGIDPSGLSGDRARAGKRAVTLLQAEHLSAIAAYLGQERIDPTVLRRNLLVSGLNLAGLKGREIDIGTARLRITTICAPCSRMERALGAGGYAAVRGHGGWCAEVVTPGTVQIGDPVTPVD